MKWTMMIKYIKEFTSFTDEFKYDYALQLFTLLWVI